MPNAVDKHFPSHRASALDQWVTQILESLGVQVKIRLRGNTLHILCQAVPCPDRTAILLKFIPELQNFDLKTLLPVNQPSIYRIQLYACPLKATRPEWTASIYLTQLDRHLERLKQLAPSSGRTSSLLVEEEASKDAGKIHESSALALSNRSLAKQGQELAIASYLSETLSDLGVGVRVHARTVPYTPPSTVQSGATPLAAMTTKRLWVACEASYSPDPSLVGEPITRRLRELEIEGYRDAVILFQVVGEHQPDWKLRVDLTPPSEMLREWARWGDVEAIRRLLNQSGESEKLKITTASLKEATLHLFCGVLSNTDSPRTIHSLLSPDRDRAQHWVMALLETLAPQGIHAVTLYGQRVGVETPTWVEWLTLPASLHPALADSALTLAQQSDWEAIAFLLHRLLNANLENYLTTGGIRLQLLPKQDLLHIMSEAPICPEQQHVGPTIAKFLRQLKLANLSGVRIYGRRAGQKLPLWSYGIDFTTRDRLVPEAAPEFAATDTLVSELVPPTDESILRPDLTPADLQSLWYRTRQRVVNSIEQALVQSQLFTASPETQALAMTSTSMVNRQSAKLAAIWGTVGLLLMVQTNWILGQMVAQKPATPQQTAPAPVDATAPVLSSTLPTESSVVPQPAATPKISLPQAPQAEDDVFNSEGFTAPRSASEPSGSELASPESAAPQPTSSPQPSAAPKPRSLPYTQPKPQANQITAEILAASPKLPTLNSRQLDDKLKLYYQYLKEKGGPPDVLVIGSSRALRGIDPEALRQTLTQLGYADMTIFNFGINGATAQVEDLLLRQILTPEQLPRTILWADGARAFNSGAVDVTYNGIAASEGYRQLLAQTFPIPTPPGAVVASEPAASGGLNLTLTSSYQSLDRWFSEQFSRLSGTYEKRDRLKHQFQQGFARLVPISTQGEAEQTPTSTAPGPSAQSPLVDPEGFLSLAIQFNPATYYQKYAKVTGQYDSDYENFKIPGQQENALRSLLQYTQSQTIPVIFVNLPLTEDYLDPVRRQHEQEFKEYMVGQAMQQPGLTFRNLGDLWTTQYGYFSDPSHLNRYGAYAISQRLAEDPLIPWQQAKSQQTMSQPIPPEATPDETRSGE